MNSTMVHPNTESVKRGRFVAATLEQQADLERQIGRNLYKRGKPLRECVSDEMAAGWLAAERKGADDYYRMMQRQASEFRCVNWNSGAEGGY